MLPTWAVITTRAADPRPTSVSLLQSVNPSRPTSDTFIYTLAPSLPTDPDLHDVTRPCIFKALHAEYRLEVVGSALTEGLRAGRGSRPGRGPRRSSGGACGFAAELPRSTQELGGGRKESTELTRSLWRPHPRARRCPFSSPPLRLRAGVSPVCCFPFGEIAVFDASLGITASACKDSRG